MNARFKSALFFILCATTSVRLAQAATCTDATGNTCTATDFTTATCTSGTCGCISGYGAIPTGCAKKLTKPTVTLPAGRTPSWSSGSDSHTLTCTIDEDSTMGTVVTYKWYRGGTIVDSETAKTLVIDAAGKVGSIQCQVGAQGSDNAALESDMSDAVVITVATGTYTPEVSYDVSGALVGYSLALTCQNVPMGLAVTFSESADLSNPLTPPITLVKNDARKLYCGSGTTASAAKDLPTISETITSVKLMRIGADSEDETELFYHTGATGGPTFTCTTDPVGTADLVFTYLTNGTDAAQGNDYALPIDTETHLTVTCKASYNEAANVTSSNSVTVTVDNDYIAAPVLTATTTNPIEGSRVVMTCGEAINGVEYSWMKGVTPILYQKDRMIQLGSVVKADETAYTCMLHKGTYTQASNQLSIAVTSTVPQPMIKRADDGDSFGENGDYELMCKTDSFTEGMIFSWKKDGTDLTNANMKYTISDASATKHNGSYTCKITFGSLSSSDSVGFPVEVVAAGKVCTGDGGCTDNEMYTGKCSTTEPRRCECESGYKMIGDACSKDGVSTIVGSTMLVLAAFVFSRLI